MNEFEVNGNWNGHNPFFIASKTSGKQLFDLTAAPANNDGRLNNITRLRFNTISNYGDHYQQVNEFEVNGNWNSHNPFFIASKTSGKQLFDLTAAPANNDGRLNNITRLRFNTISNYGDHYQQVNEFEVNGNWKGHNPFFIASKTSGKQFFDLTATPANNDGRLNNITRLRFNTISNYGDHYQQVNEFQAFGIINKRVTGALMLLTPPLLQRQYQAHFKLELLAITPSILMLSH
ncbi:MAG: hypothetical protein Q9N32_01100 [Gammaproteobacteria bacterium]|nr:hypothetical protein [Gammaproteobacteria bacterium]